MNRIVYLILVVTIISCQKNDHTKAAPEDMVHLEELQELYTQQLIDSEYGWYIDYKPLEENGSTSILMKFNNNGTVSILSDYYGYEEWESTPRFRIGGAVFPELIFESYAVWHELYNNTGGNYQFRISPISKDEFKISNARVATEEESFVLRKAEPEDELNVYAQGQVNKKIVEFRNTSEAYFQNVDLENFIGSWEIDNFTRKISFTWPDALGYPVSEVFPYYLTSRGIKFYKPIQLKNVEIDSISFGEFTSNSIEVSYAGNAGAGIIKVAHEPAFSSPGAVDYLLMASKPTERLLLNVELDDFSPNLKEEVDNLKMKMPGVVRLQVYLNDLNFPNLEHRLSFYFPSESGSGSSYANTFYNIQKTSEDQAVFSFIQKNTIGRNFSEATDPLLEKLLPPEGVTVVPYTTTALNQKVRIVSKADSRNYFTLTSMYSNYFY